MPLEQEKIIHDLRPSKVFSIHNSKFKLAIQSWDEPIKTMDAITASDHSFKLLRGKIGEVILLQ